MSESVACALEWIDDDNTQQTRLFIRMIDKFFDCMNSKGPKMALLKRKADIAPYAKETDHRFKVKLHVSHNYYYLPEILSSCSGFAVISSPI